MARPRSRNATSAGNSAKRAVSKTIGPRSRHGPGASASPAAATANWIVASARRMRSARRARFLRIEPLTRELRQQRAQPRAGEARIKVTWIFTMRDAGGAKRRNQPCLGNAKQRTHQKNRGIAAGRDRCRMRHSGEAGETAAAGEPKQHRLRLIVERVRRQDMFVSATQGRFRQQLITHVARRLLQAGFRFRAAPMHRAMRHAEPARQALHRRGFAARFRPKPVIDRDGGKFWRRTLQPLLQSLGPACGKNKERSGIGTARDREQKPA